jgi:hypothetical protein
MSTPQQKNRGLEASAHLDYISSEIVHCDDEFCPDLKDMVMDALLCAAEVKEPQLYNELINCQTQHGVNDSRCDNAFVNGMSFLLD